MSKAKRNKFIKLFGSLKLTVVIIVLLMCLWGYATYVEAQTDNRTAKEMVFHSLFADVLIALLALNVISCTVSRAPYYPYQYPWLVTHVGILVIMAGTIVSHNTSMEGTIVLRRGQTVDMVRLFTKSPVPMQVPLDFELEIDSFKVSYYPGTGKAKDYTSYVRMHDPANDFRDTLEVRVNHPIVYKGWNVSQSSFFPGDNTATILGANKDPGTWLSYTGFMIVFLGLTGLFFFRSMLKKKFPPPRGGKARKKRAKAPETASALPGEQVEN